MEVLPKLKTRSRIAPERRSAGKGPDLPYAFVPRPFGEREEAARRTTGITPRVLAGAEARSGRLRRASLAAVPALRTVVAPRASSVFGRGWRHACEHERVPRGDRVRRDRAPRGRRRDRRGLRESGRGDRPA